MPPITNSIIKKNHHPIVMFHLQNLEQVIAIKKFKD